MPRKKTTSVNSSTSVSYYEKQEHLLQVTVAPKNEEQKKLLQTISENTIIFIRGFPGTGKCITDDSLIAVESGIVPFSSVINGQVDEYTKKKIKIINRDGEYENTSHVYNSGVQKTKKITTKHGFNIEGTHNHKILCLTDNGIEWKQLSDIQIGDFTCINRKYPNNTNADKYYDPEIAYFIGILIGDGHYNMKHQFCLSNVDKEVIRFYYKFCKKHFGKLPTNSKSRTCDHYLCSAKARSKLLEWGLKPATGENKTIPQILMQESEKTQRALLRGLFDSDGGIDKCGETYFSNKSSVLCNQVQMILLRLGILSTQKTRMKKYKGVPRPHHYVVIISSCIERFNSLIGFCVNHRRIRLQNTIKKKRNTNIDVVPFFYAKPLLEQYWSRIERCDRGKKNRKYFTHYIANNPDTLRSVSYDKLNLIYNLYKEKYPDRQIEDILKSNYFFDPVKTIDNKESHVYDFVVPKTHSFVANGFVNHNTHISVSYGLQQLFRMKYEQLVFTRPVVEAAGEKLGFLPGDMQEKINPYMLPVYETLSQLIPIETINKLMTKNGKGSPIRILPLAYMRGVSFKDSFIVADEMQNCTPEQMRMLLTRIGEGCKMIICGDVYQSDIRHKNGLQDAFELLDGIASVGFVTLSEKAIVRHPIIELIEHRYMQANRNRNNV